MNGQKEQSRAYEALLDAVNEVSLHDHKEETRSLQQHVGDILRQHDDLAVIDDSIIIDPDFHSASADFLIGGAVMKISI